MKQAFLYKEGEEPKIFKDDEIEKALDDGWQDTPINKSNKPTEGKGKNSSEEDDEVATPIIDNEKYEKVHLLQVVGQYNNGDFLVQNDGDDSTQWRVDKEAFILTYRPAKKVNENASSTVITEKNDEDEEAVDLNTLSDDKLRELAKEAKIKGWNNMIRENLISKLMEQSE